FNNDFRAVNVKSPLESAKYLQAWKLSINAVFRVNVDVAIFFSQRMCGVGVVIRDEMGLVVSALSLDVVGQTGNFICKAELIVIVISVTLLRQTEDFENLKKLVDEATFYDKQWQALWQDQNAGALEQIGKKI
ncbi:light-harvesting complex-like protein 3 isotype 2, partial [Quercus suber]